MGVEQYCSRHGIALKRIFKDDLNIEENLKDVDGIVCIGKFSTAQIKKLSHYQENIIFVDMEVQPLKENCIVLDFSTAIYDVLSHLHDLKHQHIAYLSGKEYTQDAVYLKIQEKKPSYNMQKAFISKQPSSKNSFLSKAVIKWLINYASI